MNRKEQESLFTSGLPSLEALQDILRALSESDRLRFELDLLDAVYSAPNPTTAKTVRAWYKSAIHLARPDFRDKLERAERDARTLVRHDP